MDKNIKLVLFLLTLLMAGTRGWSQEAELDAAPAPEAAAPAGEEKPAPPVKPKKARKAKKKAKKPYDYDKSKYKAVIETEPSTYRFDSSGKPVRPPVKKTKKKKMSAFSSDEKSEALSSEPGDASCEGNSCASE